MHVFGLFVLFSELPVEGDELVNEEKYAVSGAARGPIREEGDLHNNVMPFVLTLVSVATVELAQSLPIQLPTCLGGIKQKGGRKDNRPVCGPEANLLACLRLAEDM